VVISREVNGLRGCIEACLETGASGIDACICSVDMVEYKKRSAETNAVCGRQ
jgi:hypothetical protein